MAKTDLLNFLKDINYVYNDCGMYDSVSKMLEDFEAEIRAKAIDEFFDELQKYEYDDWLKLKMSSIYEIAEQLKERE